MEGPRDSHAKQTWRETWKIASLGTQLEDGVLQCNLSPRRCIIREGRNGFCGVRGNRNGELVTMNYGKSVHLTEETIETEAVNHFSPGERILSLGNIGCMLNCSYCHNWKTSQARYVEDAHVHHYTPEAVIETAKRHGIRVISWTYNDPVVWHEFVMETSALAKQEGITTLYKSAFFITPEAVEQLLQVIDIFSISLKSIDHEYYKRFTTGSLQPVLDATKQVYLAGKHLELSTLMVTDISDDVESAKKISGWLLRELDATVPLHFVRFHPDYKMRDTNRTPIARLIRAREIALGMGVQHVYLGNVYDTPYSDTHCRGCGRTTVKRYGLIGRTVLLDESGACEHCGTDSSVKTLPGSVEQATVDKLPVNPAQLQQYNWSGEIRSMHVEIRNNSQGEQKFFVRHLCDTEKRPVWLVKSLAEDESYRLIVVQGGNDETGVEIAFSEGLEFRHLEVFDRAHFPTLSVEEIGASKDDNVPLPHFNGNQFPMRNRKSKY